MSNSSSQTFAAPAHFLVTITTDGTTGLASNCAGTAPANCSLRDALAAASAAGGGIVNFDPNVFSTAQTISLGGVVLNIPSNTTITGPGTGSGATYLVTIDGG